LTSIGDAKCITDPGSPLVMIDDASRSLSTRTNGGYSK
jgi:hypothetical protein